ncbi:MAG: putative toxin-antitoxin system toxin component, PIN family [Pseudomonadota bacterium]
MRVVLDTNVLVAALLTQGTPPGQLYSAWRARQFVLCSCEQQIEEIERVSRRPFFKAHLARGAAGRMVNDIRALALMCDPLPRVEAAPDPDDSFLLAIAQAARAEFLVTGDRSGLLGLRKRGVTAIVTARVFLQRIE